MHVFADSFIIFNLTVLGNGSCTVNDEIEIFVGGDADGQRVGAEHTFHTERGCYGRTCVGAGDADATCFCGHACIVACNAVVGGVTNRNHTHAVGLCLFDRHAHGFVTDDLSHAVVTVHNCGAGSLADDLKIGYGLLNAVIDAVDINRFEAVDTVGFDTSAVGFKKNVCNDGCIFCGNADTFESIDYEIVNGFPINNYFGHKKKPPFNLFPFCAIIVYHRNIGLASMILSFF